jgi:hypothetical protein
MSNCDDAKALLDFIAWTQRDSAAINIADKYLPCSCRWGWR